VIGAVGKNDKPDRIRQVEVPLFDQRLPTAHLRRRAEQSVSGFRMTLRGHVTIHGRPKSSGQAIAGLYIDGLGVHPQRPTRLGVRPVPTGRQIAPYTMEQEQCL
jgi:hypothetical protein